ncbi:MAG TPA: heavy-metal-associated domain-containing protein [Usitatibacteraceae bacterium]|nr:heavy-metal-associated domain-containing protein [Usitatibacteraceae bacterium]
MIDLAVADMTCGHCAATITGAVKALDPQSTCEVDLAARRVRVESAFSAERVRAAIERAGFHPSVVG